ncbi:MAG TPA: cytochrome c oxidase assembly protein [Pilimelia sp.]|nr:cytochrome c oxidase assembly protein [Pilimelia sp.]
MGADPHAVAHGGGALPWLLVLLPAGVTAVAYFAAVRAAARRGRAWPLWRLAAWCAGLATAVAAVRGPLGPGRHGDFAAHMTGHLLLGMLAPLLLAAAAPVTLALRALPGPAARRLARLLRAAPVRAVTHPVTAALLNVGGLWLLYTTGLYAAMADRPALHAAVHLHVLVSGYVFTAAVAGWDPSGHRARYGARAAVLVAFAAAHNILAKYLYGHPPAGVPAAEAHAGARLMYYGGDVLDVALFVVVCAQWYRAGARRAADRRVWPGTARGTAAACPTTTVTPPACAAPRATSSAGRTCAPASSRRCAPSSPAATPSP